MRTPNELRDRLRFAVFNGAGGARYQVRDLLGEGGQGWVFKASQDDAGAPFVVVKVLRPDLVGSDAFARFEREASVLRALSAGPSPHPNIVRFYEHGRATVQGPDGPIEVPYLVLEFIDGPTLSRVLAAHGGFGLPVARVRRLFRQIARALSDLHGQHIIHRDLKPSNILLAQRESTEIAKVTDFGLVKRVDAPMNQTVTVAGMSAGYAPPEQYEVGNRRVSARTDVFAFGAMLFEALSGCEAFPVAPGDTALRTVARMLSGDRPALARVSATIPRELRDRPELTSALDRELGRATDGDPVKRHGSIDELWGAVEPLLRAATSGSAHNLAKVSEPPPASMPASGPADQGEPSDPAPNVRVTGKPMTGERLRGAAFSEGGSSLVAIGAYGLYRFANGVWSALRAPRGVDGRSLRGVARAPSGSLLLFGEGCAALLSESGTATRVETGEPDAVWLGALADARGMILVGERRSRPVGVVAVIPTGGSPSVHTLEGTSRLHAAARLDGELLVVCGTHGALCMLDGSEAREIVWGRTGHLFAAAATRDGGAYVVGSGGHALAVAPPNRSLRHVAPPATLEAVQTTRDLCGVTVDPSGTAWAVGSQGRLLVRRGGTWSRLTADAGVVGLIALTTRSNGGRVREVVALAEDGTVVEVLLD